MFSCRTMKDNFLDTPGPSCSNVVSLTSSLRVISLTVLVDSIHNILIFFAEKMLVLQKLLTFFSKTFQHICVSFGVNFNKSLTNDVVSFEQLGPGVLKRDNYIVHQGPVVQSVVSLTTSLRVISLTVLADSIYIILICFAEKM